MANGPTKQTRTPATPEQKAPTGYFISAEQLQQMAAHLGEIPAKYSFPLIVMMQQLPATGLAVEVGGAAAPEAV